MARLLPIRFQGRDAAPSAASFQGPIERGDCTRALVAAVAWKLYKTLCYGLGQEL